MVLKSTGKKASRLRELKDRIAEAGEGVLFHHTYQYFLKEHVLEYTNDFAHWAGESLEERALAEHLSLHQHGDPLREAEHQVHVVFDDEDGDLRGQAVEHLENARGLERRDAGGGLVEQEDLRLQAERDRDLELAARRFLDLYAMALPYRVSIVVGAASDPNRG